MAKSSKATFLIHAIVSVLFGAPLLLAPGRFLGLFDWAPIDPLTSRLLGSALLALGWGSYRSWRSTTWKDISAIVEMEIESVYLIILQGLKSAYNSRNPNPDVNPSATIC